MLVSRLKFGSFALVAALLVAGCSRTATDPAAPKASPTASGHTHDGWWCGEHGVPEGECTQCNAKLAADAQKKGDWCKEHNRAESQCFICHPEKAAEFAAKYEAKYGEKPPKIGEAGHGHEHSHEDAKPKS